MARLDRGDRPERRSCDLAALCREETDRAAVLAPNLRVSFRVVNGSRTVDVDPDAIREALANMLDNARRHAVSRIEVTLVRKPNDAEVSVADDGPGLTESSAERAFEPFVVLDGHGGSGLGLTIARGTARAHGGDVTYEEGHFMLRLPMEPRAGPADTSAKSAEDAPLDRGTGALR
jgi:signal transduction histidine kinase